MNVVVTGHKGFIGTQLMKYLPTATGLDIKDGNDILSCHLPDADIVIHLAAEPGVVKSMASPITNAETNIMGTLRLLQRYKDSKFIFASSGGTIQESIESPYGLSKYVGEEYLKLLHPNHVILRFCNVYGKGSRSVVDKWLNEEELTIYGDGKTNRIYGHVSDIVAAILLALTWENGTYKLGSSQRYSVNAIAKAIGKPVKHVAPRPGEITHTRSQLFNETPNWEPKVDLMRYIKDVKYRNSL
jgi:UDP-glucose 4-epimerase